MLVFRTFGYRYDYLWRQHISQSYNTLRESILCVRGQVFSSLQNKLEKVNEDLTTKYNKKKNKKKTLTVPGCSTSSKAIKIFSNTADLHDNVNTFPNSFVLMQQIVRQKYIF